jgi:hypothetical protein
MTVWIWDERGTRIVRTSFVRNFTFEEKGDRGVTIIGWFNDKESFRIKTCQDLEEARKFLVKIIGEDEV